MLCWSILPQCAGFYDSVDSRVPRALGRRECHPVVCMLGRASERQGSGAASGKGSWSKSFLSLVVSGHGRLSQPQ